MYPHPGLIARLLLPLSTTRMHRVLHSILDTDVTEWRHEFHDICNLAADPHATFLEYAREAQQNIAATISEKNLAELPKIAYAIHNCRRVAFFSHHFLWDTGRYLQNKLFSMGKVMDLYLDQASQLACAQSLQPEDLAIICSVGGGYPIRYVDVCNSIRDSKCSMLAITQKRLEPILESGRLHHAVRRVECQRHGQIRGARGN